MFADNNHHSASKDEVTTSNSVLPFILFVDDDLDALDVLSWFAKRWDFHTAAVDTGREAIEVAVSKHPDIIVLDVMMPDMNGFDVLDALKADIRAAHIPVIILTAGAVDEPFKVKGREKGASEYLIKPINPYELMSRINYHLRRHRLDTDTTLVPRSGAEEDASRGSAILVVDDDIHVLEVLETALEELKRDVLIARNAFEALAILRESGDSIGLLITDLQMPEMSGVALIKRCMLLYPEVPVLAISGQVGHFQRELDTLPTPVATLQKPLDLTSLRKTATRLLARTSVFSGR